MQKKYFLTLNIILLGLIIILTSNFLIYPVISSDSSYFLSIARAFYNGNVYFKEITTNYNPIAILIIGIPHYFSDQHFIRINLLINFVFIFGSTFTLFKILSRKLQSKIEIIFYCLLFLCGTIMLESKSILLEPISVFFQITGFYFYLKFREKLSYFDLFCAGFLIALSFLSKQYGLFILGAIGIDFLINLKYFLKKFLIISAGFLIPILIFYIYLAVNNVDTQQFINYILGKRVQLDQGIGTGIYYNLKTFLISITVFLITNSYLLLVPMLLFKNIKQKPNDIFIYILALLCSFLILIKASYYHYFQYIIPYSIITFAILEFHNRNKFMTILKNIAFFGSILFMSYSSLKPLKNNEIDFKEQNQIANKINHYLPKKSKVILQGLSPQYYYLCDFESINLSRIGFPYQEDFFAKTIVENIKSGSYILISKPYCENYSKYFDQFLVEQITINKKILFILKKK